MQADNITINDRLSRREIELLKRLPSVKERHIDVADVCRKNQLTVVRDRRKNRILTVSCFHNFGDFAYAHTTIGRDACKVPLFERLFDRATRLAPTYFVLFNSRASVEAAFRFGAVEVSLDHCETQFESFVRRVNWLTGRSFYRNGDVLMDRDDPTPVKNPIYLVTRGAFLGSLERPATAHSRHRMAGE